MNRAFTESVVEDAALAWLEALGYAVLLGGWLRQALVRLNPDLPADVLDDAYRKLTRADAPSLVERNPAVRRMLHVRNAESISEAAP